MTEALHTDGHGVHAHVIYCYQSRNNLNSVINKYFC